MSRDLSERYFPFERLGLRGNPFRALTEDEWAALAWLHPALLAALDQASPILQILGASGRGKSSALLAVKRELLARGREPHYLYLPPGMHRLKRDQQSGDPLLLDEIERLPPRSRRRLFRAALGLPGKAPQLVFSSHGDLAREVEAIQPGVLASIPLPPITGGQLADLLHARIRAESIAGDPPVWFDDQAINLLIEYFGDDLRTMERTLYEAFQRLDAAGRIDRARLQRLVELSGANLAPG
ncbi:MAG: hypothetical protein ACK2T2_04895 [Anaerolineales bacterium]